MVVPSKELDQWAEDLASSSEFIRSVMAMRSIAEKGRRINKESYLPATFF